MTRVWRQKIIREQMSTPKKEKKLLSVEQKIKRRNFISFATFFVVGTAALGGWKWLYTSNIETAGVTGGARKPLRRALNKTELFFRKFFSNSHLVQTYPKSMAAKKVRVNSNMALIGRGSNPKAGNSLFKAVASPFWN